jgi:hypothetical protein
VNTASELLFAWEPAHVRRAAIFGFLALSVLGHAFCFYLFQIVYPPTVALLPPPARVNFISENSEESRALLQWVAAEDPALATTTQRSPEAKAFALPKLSHVPSYLTVQPALKSWPAATPEVRPPSALPLGPVPITRAQNQLPRVVAPTTIAFTAADASLGKVEQPPMKFSASTRETPQPAIFRIAIRGNGIVCYCLLQNSSGDAGLDEQARSYIQQCRFPAASDAGSPEQLKWATATFEWGNDLTAPPAAGGKETAP